MNKKRGPKKKLSTPFLQEKNNILAESDKGSWFDQEPLTSSATAEVPQLKNQSQCRSQTRLFVGI